VRSLIDMNRNVEDVKADVNHLHTALQRAEHKIADLTATFIKVSEEEKLINAGLLQDLHKAGDVIHEELSSMQLNIDCFNDQTDDISTILHHLTASHDVVNQNLKTLGAVLKVPTVALNPFTKPDGVIKSDDDKKGENKGEEPTKDTIATEEKKTDEPAELTKAAEEEPGKVQSEDKSEEETKEKAKADEEKAESKDSANDESELTKYRNTESARKAMELLREQQLKEKMDAAKEVILQGEEADEDEEDDEESSYEYEEVLEESDEEADD
jgi:dGTP triphosphohydrolase